MLNFNRAISADFFYFFSFVEPSFSTRPFLHAGSLIKFGEKKLVKKRKKERKNSGAGK